MDISDITVLLNAIFHKTGLVTFHGNDLMWGLGRNPTPYDRNEFVSWLVDGASGEIPPNAERQPIRSGVGQGKLQGGNLNCLMKLAGTPYFQQLKQIGVFDQVVGTVVGYNDGLQNNPQARMQDGHFEQKYGEGATQVNQVDLQ